MIAFFTATVVVSAIGFGLIWMNLHNLKGEIQSFYEQDYQSLDKINTLSYNALAQVSNLRGYIIYEKPEMLTAFETLRDSNKALEQELLAVTEDEKGNALIQSIQTLDADYNNLAETQLIPMLKSGKKAEATAYAATVLSPIGKDMVTQVEAYKAYQLEGINTAFEEIHGDAGTSQNQAVIFSIASAILGILIGLFAAESISRPINTIAASAKHVAQGDLTTSIAVDREDEIGVLAEAFNTMIRELRVLVHKVIEESEHLAGASEELTAGAEQSAQAAGQVAESVGEMARSSQQQTHATQSAASIIEELSGSSQEISANTHHVAQQAQEAAHKANEGIQLVDSAVRQIDKIHTTVSNSSEIVERLGERSREVDLIVETISGIADQTNLLALNAAIEAARAGEQGRGFSVVAEEVRKLAEQSQEATKKIAAIIALIQHETRLAVESMKSGTLEVQEGTLVVQNAGHAFHSIAGLVNQVSGDVSEISTAVEQMANGNQDVVGSITQIDALSRSVSDEAQGISAATEEQLATMEEIASSSQTISKMAEDLRDAVKRFTI